MSSILQLMRAYDSQAFPVISEAEPEGLLPVMLPVGQQQQRAGFPAEDDV